MQNFSSNISFTKFFSGIILAILFSIFFSFFTIENSFAEETSGQKDNTISIREAFPGESNIIDVSKNKGSLNILSTYISSIFRFVAALSVIIAVLVLMTAGFMIMTAGGDTGPRDTAKEWIGKTFMGLAFLFLAGLFLKTVNPNFYIFGEKGGSEKNTDTTQSQPIGGQGYQYYQEQIENPTGENCEEEDDC